MSRVINGLVNGTRYVQMEISGQRLTLITFLCAVMAWLRFSSTFTALPVMLLDWCLSRLAAGKGEV